MNDLFLRENGFTMFLPGSSIIEDARRHCANLIAWIVLDKPDLSSANNPQTRKFHFFFLVSDLLSDLAIFLPSRMPEAMAVIGIKFPFTYSSTRKSRATAFAFPPSAVSVKRFKKRKNVQVQKLQFSDDVTVIFPTNTVIIYLSCFNTFRNVTYEYQRHSHISLRIFLFYFILLYMEMNYIFIFPILFPVLLFLLFISLKSIYE